eukprot:TRINITY_DN91823_c0_g1_i1.p1 TRINITY_DN91823_c0_g1~~TRINITY_DN91823_c0_g1_i1.p1  ORF type:complete len:408 (+),score=98.24 TRINITY_DN91823_c0_g1_i1:127-1350(+)
MANHVVNTSASRNATLTLSGLRRVRELWNHKVERVTFSELQGREGRSRIMVAQKTHHAMKLRMAHRLQDFLMLPYQVMANPNVRQLYETYVSAYNVHSDLEEMKTPEAVDMYWVMLAHMVGQHTGVVTKLLGESRRQLVDLDPNLAQPFDAFLDRFFMSRIGTHLLGSHFLQFWPPEQPQMRKPGGVVLGVLQETRPASIVKDLAESLSVSPSGHVTPVDVQVSKDACAEILYIPSHLRVILREIMMNAITASNRAAERRGEQPEAVRVQVHRGKGGIFFTVSDRGGGIQDMEGIWHWGSDAAPARAQPETTCRNSAMAASRDADEALHGYAWKQPSEEEQQSAADSRRPLPLGFGLPLARLTARYFGGDVRFQTLVGYGTNAYVNIPEIHGDFAAIGDLRGGRSQA